LYDMWYRDLLQSLQVHHWCNNRRCANPAHLSQGTNDDNVAYMVSQGRQASGERNGSHVLAEHEVLSIWDAFYAGTITTGKLAENYGVSRGTISNILHGKGWIKALRDNGRFCN
jgi:hypothetical protein